MTRMWGGPRGHAQRRSERITGALVAMMLLTGCADGTPAAAAGETGKAARPSYALRLDGETSAIEDFRLVEDDDGIRIRSGPAGIAYRSDDVLTSGDFHVEATFLQYDAPLGYREAYGIFVGGRELDEPDQEYTYLLVRPTGDFLVKRRIGEITETLADWTPTETVRQIVETGDEPLNTLAVDVFDGVTRFLVNDVVVFSLPAARARPYGIAGIRVNHRLDVRVDDWILQDTSTQS